MQILQRAFSGVQDLVRHGEHVVSKGAEGLVYCATALLVLVLLLVLILEKTAGSRTWTITVHGTE